MKKKIAFVSGWYNFGGNQGISDDCRFMTNSLYDSAKKYFLPNHDVEFIFMTNGDFTIDGVTNINFDYKIEGFWHMCLMKILSLKYLKDEYDYIFVNDNDQIYINEVNEDILNHDMSIVEHFFTPTIKAVHDEITDSVDLNFDTTSENWTMGNFFGGKQETMRHLLNLSLKWHEFYLTKPLKEGVGFYCRYPEELFLIKFIFENKINFNRLNTVVDFHLTNDKFFLSDFRDNGDFYPKTDNVKLLHNTKKNLNKLKEIIKFYK
jgi:hypothetical protein